MKRRTRGIKGLILAVLTMVAFVAITLQRPMGDEPDALSLINSIKMQQMVNDVYE